MHNFVLLFFSTTEKCVTVQKTNKKQTKNKQKTKKQKTKLQCGPMPNVMAALPNIGGALCSTPQSFADAHY